MVPFTKKIMLLVLTMALPSALRAAVESDVQLATKNPAMKFYDIKEVCLKMGYPHTLLASAAGLSRIDCMGTKILVTDFCRKEFPEHPRLLRGIISADQKAVCHFAASAILTVSCDRFSSFCQEALKGCQQLTPYYAAHHQLLHSGISHRQDQKVLQCFYAEKEITPEQ